MSPSASPPASPASPAASDCSIATERDTIEKQQIKLFHAYEIFESTGDRPSQEMDVDPGPCPTLTLENATREGECSHCYEHYRKQNGQFVPRLRAWQEFLDFRKRWCTPDQFAQYEVSTFQHMQELGITWKLEMKPELQTKLDKWREFYVHVCGRKLGHARKRQAEAQKQLDRLAKLPPEEVAKEAQDRRFADGTFSHRLQAPDYWRDEKDFWCGVARNRGQLQPWIEKELSNIQEKFTPASLQPVAQKRRLLVRSNRIRTRKSERLQKQPAPHLPKLPVRPTRVFKSRKRRRLQV